MSIKKTVLIKPAFKKHFTDKIKKAKELYKKGNYKKAVTLFKEILNRSFKPHIACLLGKCYLYGKGTNKDSKKAGYLFSEAFHYGYNKAYYYLAKHHEKKYERDIVLHSLKNYDLACFIGRKTEMMALFKKGAEKGHSESCYKLGQCYSYTPHFNLNPLSKNLEWYIKAAGGGHLKAMYDLGWVFQNGKQFSMQKDYVSAAMWYKRAAEKGFVKAMIALSWCYRRGKGVKKDKKKAMYWLNKAKANKSVYSRITRRLKIGDKIIDSHTKGEPETILITCTCNKDIQCAVSDKSREKGIAAYEFGSRVYVRSRDCFGSKNCYTRISNVKAFADKFMQNEWKAKGRKK